MYSSGYSKYSPPSLKRKQHRSKKGKSCGYYLRIVFFFSSLIQSLIIVSLVLFLVYGKTQDSASTSGMQDLEESFSRLSIENVALRQQRKNLTNLLNSTLTQKARNDWDLAKLRSYSNISLNIIQDYERKLQHCTSNLYVCNNSARLHCNCAAVKTFSVPDNCDCGAFVGQLKAHLQLVQSNFTQTVQKMKMDLDQTTKERDYINLEAIRLRRDKTTKEKELLFQKEKCKGDFFQSLSGVSNVSRVFVRKIESLFPEHLRFQLTCQKQREHLEQIHKNCTNLSREVEDKLQRYLNTVGDQVSDIQSENSRLKAENERTFEDFRVCNQNRSGLMREYKLDLERRQQIHDKEKEKLLIDKMKLSGEKEVLENSVAYRIKEVEHLTLQINQLNMSCMYKTQPSLSNTQQSTPSRSGWSLFGGSSSSSSNTNSQAGRSGSVGLGSNPNSGTSLNKVGSSYPSTGSSSTTGSLGSNLNRYGSGGLGSSSSSSSSTSTLNRHGSTSSSSSSGLAYDRHGSSSSSPSTGSNSGLGSPGSGLNRLGSNGLGSTNSGLNKYGSSSSSSTSSESSSILNARSSVGTTDVKQQPSSTGYGLNKPALNPRSSSSSSTSTGSTGTNSKTGSSGSAFSWFGFSNTGQSKSTPGTGTGTGTGRGTSSSSTNTGTSSSYTARASSGSGVNVAQHLQDLHRLIYPSAQEEKDDLSRMMG